MLSEKPLYLRNACYKILCKFWKCSFSDKKEKGRARPECHITFIIPVSDSLIFGKCDPSFLAYFAKPRLIVHDLLSIKMVIVPFY